ncbi:DNA recombination protein RmuC [Methylocapsa palsarum]|uniref:DNA recombination protein RmuC homolog n=1 Tax=Methylocapsa palsarum TaxID=1612308 RepID=A0A1I3W014_9HYPH|nr:DNA recombination protein RmuC [Methylocapsa palsarum]SFK00782.1 DNA recombination protein RmuC [Methylocapsa palsarum]
MDRVVFLLNKTPVSVSDLLLAAAALAILLLAKAAFRSGRAPASNERQRELERKINAIGRQGAELNGSLRSIAEVLGSRQADLARLVTERLDTVGERVGHGLEASGKTAGDHLARLNERLAVIDAAQARLTSLTEEVVGLKDILANKQARGAFGQGRLEAIIRDALPDSAYAFQYTLSNNTRPDCVIRLPGDHRLMVVDAKFPLEAFIALKESANEEARKYASARVRADVGKHIRDIGERYFLPDETQDIAILFVPSESLYADINEHFADVVQKAQRSRIILVSPSLLVMAVQVMQAIVRDARVREQTHIIQAEVRRLVEDVARLRARVARLEGHFKNAQDDVASVVVSAERIARTGARIDNMDFTQPAEQQAIEKMKAAE